jgi:acid phosphatase type 7
VFNETVLAHNYTNPQAPVHIISGVAGCNEDLGLCLNPIYHTKGPWSAFHQSGLLTYGYGKLTVHNSTHIEWQEMLDWDEAPVDHIWISQTNHGPF